ncbi:hypothetical protein LUZ60_003272 [Juncus effusus]|nr:hypothetical protein LUZ60_003272 [Juncus effusus]
MANSPPESVYNSCSEEEEEPSAPLMEEKRKMMNQAKLKPMDLDPPLTEYKTKPLALDIISNILTRMDGIKLVDLQFTCKDWWFLTRESFFVDLHLSRASVLPGVILFFQDENSGCEISKFLILNHLFQPQFTLKRDSVSDQVLVTPPCNGLICMYNFSYNITVLNPTTREVIDLPKPTVNKRNVINAYPKCYFGFEPLRKEYKVIRFFYRKMDHVNEIYDLVCQIFTLGKVYWKNISIINLYPAGPGINVNGFIYWIIGANNPLKDKIIALDLNTERFKEIYLNEVITHFEEIDNGNELIISLAKLEGNICVILTRFFGVTSIDIWMLKDYIEQKWVLRGNLKLPSNMKDQRYKMEIISLCGKKVLIRSGRSFYEYCLDKKRIKKVYEVNNNIRGTNFKAFPFVQSLVSLGNSNCLKLKDV